MERRRTTWLPAALGAVIAVLPTAEARPYEPDVVHVRETLRQRFARGSKTSFAVESRARLTANVNVAFPDVRPDTVGADTLLRFRNGSYEFASRLGDAVRYRPGARRLTFRASDGAGARVRVRARLLPLGDSGTHVELRLRAASVPLVCDAERGAPTGTRRLPLDAAVRLDGATVHFAGDGPAQVALRTVDVLGSPVPLSTIAYAARGLPVSDEEDVDPPTLEITSPADGAVLSGPAPVLAGVARDDQSIASVTMELNGAAPVDLVLDLRDGDAGLGSVAAQFTTPLVPVTGTNTLRIVARDVAGNAAEATVSFVHSTPRTVSVSVGFSHTLFVENGTLYGCGWNNFGQCGDGTRTAKPRPTPVSGLSGVRAVAAGGNHSLVLLDDGSVLAMGDNRWGEVGDGTEETRTSPTPVTGLGSGVVAIAAGLHHSVAVKADGTVWVWGSNAVGLFGSDIGDVNGTIDTPRQVAGITDAVDVATGVYHSVLLAADGTVWTLGSNANGQLGRETPSTGAARVTGVSGATAVSAGAYSTLVLRDDGSVTGWGSNDTLVLGPARSTERSPVSVPDLAGVTSLTSGFYYALFLDADGGLRARGNIGQLFGPTGDFATDTLPTTTALAVLDDVVGAWASDHHAVLQRRDGTLWALGFNNWGQLGIGTTSNQFVTTATRVLLPE